MPNYKKEEKAMIDIAKEFFIEHSPKKLGDRLEAKSDEVVQFYHDSGMITSVGAHKIMWAILNKADLSTEIKTHEDISKRKTEKEKAFYVAVDEKKEDRAIIKMEEEAAKIMEAAEIKKEELRIKKAEQIKELQEKKARLEAQAKEI